MGDGCGKITPDFKKMMVLVVMAAVAMNIVLMEIPSEILPGGHWPEFLVFGKEPGDGALFFLGRSLCT